MKIRFNFIALVTGFIWLMHSAPCFSQSYTPFTITTYDPASSGYYFACPIKIGVNPTGVPPTHMILDDKGKVVYYKNFPLGIPTGDFKLHNNGLISYSYQGKFYIMDSTFMVVDTVFSKNGILSDTHDLLMLPNGNFVLLGYENIPMDLSAYSFGVNNVPGSTTATVIAGVIQEQDSNKNVVFEWHAIDHFLFDDIDEAWLINPNTVDWTHCNAVEVDFDGNLLLCSRHFNEITKINRATGGVMWRMGGNANMFNFLNDTMQFKRQHDIRRIANGNLTLFDNGQSVPGNPFHFASGKEYQVDEINFTAELVWSYIDNVTEYSRSMGNFQRMPGGNSLIGYGNSATENKFLQAVSDSGQVVFELSFDDTMSTYRAFNYPAFPWSLNRPQITCYENSGQHYLDAGAGYASYLWSDGSTTQIIPVISTGSYTVFVPKGQGGFISSESYEVYNMADPCGLSGLTDQETGFIMATPNPVHEVVHLVFNKNSKEPQFEMFNAAGQMVYSNIVPENGQLSVNMAGFHAGVYYIRHEDRIAKIVKY